MNRIFLVGALVLTSICSYAQLVPWFLPGNNITLPTEYMGCDGSSLAPLQIKTIPDLNIQISTSDIERFRLLPDNTYTVGSSTVIADGFSLHCPDVAAFYAAGAPGPFSLEHLAAAIDNDFQDAYRDWARIGTTYTGGKTMAYVGLKDGDEHSDLAIQLAKRS